MVFTRKFSQFLAGNVTQAVGVTSGANTIGPGSGGASITYTFTQATPVVPALYLGAAVRVDVATGLWETTLATTPLKAEFYGFITAISGTTYTVQFAGPVLTGIPLGGLAVFAAGTPYYLSDTVAGGISAIPPVINGEVNLPVLWAMDNGNPVIKMSRGFVQGGGGGGGGGPTPPNNVATVTQNPNTFALGDALYILADQNFAKSNAHTTLAAAQAEWVVTSIITPGVSFTIQQGGQIHGLIATDDVGAAIVSGPIYYISPIVGQEGKLTSTQPIAPGLYSKPFYTQQVLGSNTGWLLDQRPQTASNSSFVYLGQLSALSPDGNFTDLTILSRNGTFGSYFFIAAALGGTSVVNASLGLQVYGGGVFETIGYTYYLDGLNSTVPGGAEWFDVEQGQTNLTLFPPIGISPVVVSGFGYLHLFPTFGVDVEWQGFGGPNGGAGAGYTVKGQLLCGNATIVTGLRLAVSAGTVGNSGYIKIWGIPNS